MTVTFKGRKIVKGKARGEALVSKEPISFLGGVDHLTGDVVEKGHELEGCNVTGKILIYPTGKGSTGGSYRIYDMVYRKTAPLALVNRDAEAITVIGAVMGNIPMVDGINLNLFESVQSGDWVEVDGDKGIVRIEKKTSLERGK